MIFFPVGCVLFILLALLVPVLLLLLLLDVVTFGFERLGIPSQAAVAILFAMLVGSLVNIPVTRRTVEHSRAGRFGWFDVPVRHEYGLAVNLGGAIIPAGLAVYLLFQAPFYPTLIATTVMIVVCKFLTRAIPGRGLAIPMFVPPLLATGLALALGGEAAPQVAFISGVLGTLIGGDLLNLGKARKLGAGIVSIGGAGVFDGIFLIGMFSVLLTAIPPLLGISW